MDRESFAPSNQVNEGITDMPVRRLKPHEWGHGLSDKSSCEPPPIMGNDGQIFYEADVPDVGRFGLVDRGRPILDLEEEDFAE